MLKMKAAGGGGMQKKGVNQTRTLATRSQSMATIGKEEADKGMPLRNAPKGSTSVQKLPPLIKKETSGQELPTSLTERQQSRDV